MINQTKNYLNSLLDWIEKHEKELILGIGLFFMLFYLLTASRFPVPWLDEVCYADPAIRYVQGHGWTSVAWYSQNSDEFWVSNVPLYPMLLVPWLWVFGTSMEAVRSFAYTLLPISLWFLWKTLRHMHPTWQGRWRILCILMIATADGVVFSHRLTRSDSLCMLLAAVLLFYATKASLKQNAWKCVICAALIPWAGLQLLPPLATICATILLLRPKENFPKVAWIGTGVMLGLLTFAAWLWFVDGIQDFLAAISPHCGTAKQTSIPQHVIQAMTKGIQVDRASKILILAWILMVAYHAWSRSLSWKTPYLIGMPLALACGISIGLAGKNMMPYYGYITIIPLAWAVCGFAATGTSRLTVLLTSSAFLLTAISGFVMSAGMSILAWKERDPVAYREFLLKHLTSKDAIYSNSAAYYVLCNDKKRFYSGSYMEQHTELPKEVNVVIFGGDRPVDMRINSNMDTWGFRRVASYEPELGTLGAVAKRLNLSPKLSYRCEIYRR